MYPPPQSNQHTVSAPEHHTHDFTGGILKATHIRTHSHHEQPFSYEYVLEDGKLPALAEFHPMNKKSQQSLPPPPQLHYPSSIQRSKSLKRKEKHPHFNPITQEIHMPTPERTSDRLKRAFSLSGKKSSSGPRRTPSQLHPRDVPIPRRARTTISPPPVDSRVPSLVLPTPSPSPEPVRSSIGSSIKVPINYSLPRSSWASYGDEDDLRDLAFLRETALGRMTPSPQPYVQLNRNKALAVLGITDFPYTPPYTPLSSAAPSVRGYHSHMSSRRTSAENRRSQHISPTQEQVPVQQQQIMEQQESPKASQQATEKPTARESPIATPRPRPPLRRKTSKFTEHLDANAEKLAFAPAARPPTVVITQPRVVTDPDLIAPISGRALAPLRRSVSMRTPSPNPGSWGVVCTASAKPIVATGHARMVSS